MHVNLLVRQKQFMIFFDDFKKLLAPMNDMRFLKTSSLNEFDSKKYLILTYSLYLAIMLVFIMINSLDVIPQFIGAKTDELVKDTISTLKFTFKVLQSYGDTFASFFTALADIIPIFIYYHAAIAVDLLSQQWSSIRALILKREMEMKNQSSMENQQYAATVFEQETRQISRIYDSIVHLVTRADHLFGHIVIFSNGLSIYAICCFVPRLLKAPLNDEHPYLPYTFAVFTLRLIWPIFMSSKLYTSAGRLRAAVLSFQSCVDLSYVSPLEKEAVTYLLNQLQDHKLAASPMGLYSITPSVLLHILSITVTYIIILIQASE